MPGCESFKQKAQEIEPLQDHCGFTAIYRQNQTDSLQFLTGYAGLLKLQTRGYDGSGYYSLSSDGTSMHYQNHGMINQVFSPEVINTHKDFQSQTTLFQTRYGTHGNQALENVQPLIRRSSQNDEFAVVHNGQFSDEPDTTQAHDLSDTVLFANQLAQAPETNWDERIVNLLANKNGAWSLAISTNNGLYLARDSKGYRPLWFGKKVESDSGETIWIAASETSALQAMGISSESYTEVPPGAIYRIDEKGLTVIQKHNPQDTQAPCIFENIYLQDKGSRQHQPYFENKPVQTVEEFRQRCGRLLADRYPVKANLAIGIPGTGIAGGEAYANELGIPYIQAINDRTPQDDQRTFMSPDIDEIAKLVQEHFYFYKNSLEGNEIVIIDDSVVRGNITKNLIEVLTRPVDQGGCGVSKVHVRILCLPVNKPCHFGINTRNSNELMANQYITPETEADLVAVAKMIEEMRQKMNATSLAFMTKEMIEEAAGHTSFCMGCMVGQHPPVDRKGMLIRPEEIIYTAK